MHGVLSRAGLDDARLEPVRGPESFAWPQAVPAALALLGRAGRGRGGERALGAIALALALGEGDPRLQPLTRALGRGESQNVVATIEPRGRVERTLCLTSHLDSSRSGLLFDPRLAPRLRGLINLLTASLLVRCAALVEPGLVPGLRGLSRAAAIPLAAALALLIERELCGEDVPGANDNASGVGVAATICCELAAAPAATTRVVFLATGCEESGTVGMRTFLESHDTDDWLFLNLDGVGGPATLRYLPREGVGRVYAADPSLCKIAASVASDRPELGLARAERLVGLTYDATQVLARGGRALTLSVQDEAIPNYHTPEDTAANLDFEVLSRAIDVVREFIAAVDRGDADARL